eukprot:5560382-Amphidinium_carterae.2
MLITTPDFTDNETYTVTCVIMFSKREWKLSRFMHGNSLAFTSQDWPVGHEAEARPKFTTVVFGPINP